MFAPPTTKKAKPGTEGKSRAEPSNSAKQSSQINPVWQTLAFRSACLQAKLTVSQPDDPYEQEADRVADRVMRMAEPQAQNVSLSTTSLTSLQRSCAGCEDEETKIVQRKPVGPNSAPDTAPPSVRDVLNSPGQPLHQDTRTLLEPQFGYDFSDVRIHANQRAADSAAEVNARAFTVNRDIVFAAGQYSPSTASGRRLIAHELTHVVQQGSIGPGSHSATATLQRDEGTSSAPPTAPVSEKDSGSAKTEKPTDAFFEWWKKVIKLEGTLEDWLKQGANKYDKGKETNMGITRGTFAQLHAAAGLPDTDEAFAAMTPHQAMLIGRTIWKKSRADKINNPGVALIVADWYWGSTIYAFARVKKVLTAMGYVVDMSKVNTTYDDLDSLTLGLINSLPPADLIKAFSDERQQHFTDIIKKDKTQEAFETGWRERAEERRTQAEAFKDVPVKRDDRAMLYQAFMKEFNAGNLEEAVKHLNFFNPPDIERFVKPLKAPEIAALHEAAVTTVGPDSNAAKITRYRFLVHTAEWAVKDGEWPKAAFFLNGFSREDLQFYFKKWKLKRAQLTELHKAAVAHTGIGADSQLAQMTKPPDK